MTAAATALILGFAGSHAQAQVGRSASTVTAQDKQAPVMDFGPHPSEGADAIVVITPDANYELHRPLKTKRIISGRMVSNERTLVSISEGAITHAPETITAPLEKGKPVKLFLRRYPDGNDYYITAVFPADFPSEVTK